LFSDTNIKSTQTSFYLYWHLENNKIEWLKYRLVSNKKIKKHPIRWCLYHWWKSYLTSMMLNPHSYFLKCSKQYRKEKIIRICLSRLTAYEKPLKSWFYMRLFKSNQDAILAWTTKRENEIIRLRSCKVTLPLDRRHNDGTLPAAIDLKFYGSTRHKLLASSLPCFASYFRRFDSKICSQRRLFRGHSINSYLSERVRWTCRSRYSWLLMWY